MVFRLMSDSWASGRAARVAGAGFSKRPATALVAFFWRLRRPRPNSQFPDMRGLRPAPLRGCGCRSQAGRRVKLGRMPGRKWTCANSPQSVGGPRAGDTGGGSSGSPRSVRLFWRLGRNSNGGNVSEPGSRHPSPPCAHVLNAQRAHHAAGQLARSAPVWAASLGLASSLRYVLLAALTGLSCGHNGTPDSRSRCRD